jgi:hypothetical protein
MRHATFAAALFTALLSGPVQAIPVGTGVNVRAAYAFPTFGATVLTPTSFVLQFGANDLFGPGDALAILYLDTNFNPLSYTTFANVGTTEDATIGFDFGANDMLLPNAAPEVLQTAFVEVVGLSGSFELLSASLFANEDTGVIIQRSVQVTNFDQVYAAPAPVPLPSPVPLPAPLALMLSSLGMLIFGHRAEARRTRRAPC